MGFSLLTVFDLTVQIKSRTYLPVIPQSLVILNKLNMESGAGMQRGFSSLTVFEAPSLRRMHRPRWGEFAGAEIDGTSRPRARRWRTDGNRGGGRRRVEAAKRVAVQSQRRQLACEVTRADSEARSPVRSSTVCAGE
jgi:hypothetical protein